MMKVTSILNLLVELLLINKWMMKSRRWIEFACYQNSYTLFKFTNIHILYYIHDPTCIMGFWGFGASARPELVPVHRRAARRRGASARTWPSPGAVEAAAARRARDRGRPGEVPGAGQRRAQPQAARRSATSRRSAAPTHRVTVTFTLNTIKAPAPPAVGGDGRWLGGFELTEYYPALESWFVGRAVDAPGLPAAAPDRLAVLGAGPVDGGRRDRARRQAVPRRQPRHRAAG